MESNDDVNEPRATRKKSDDNIVYCNDQPQLIAFQSLFIKQTKPTSCPTAQTTKIETFSRNCFET